MITFFFFRASFEIFFFFQAEDGIRDTSVTGVQTCALPIYCEALNPQFQQLLILPLAHPGGNRFLPIFVCGKDPDHIVSPDMSPIPVSCLLWPLDRKSTRLNSSHRCISYAVFCLKKKKKSKN